MIDSEFVTAFSGEVINALRKISKEEISKAASILFEAYKNNANIYVFGNGGSLAMASHWVSDFNKTAFNGAPAPGQRFRAVRIPVTHEELTAWANDVGYDMVFLGPLRNYLEPKDVVVAISSSGNSPNVIKAVEFAKECGNQVIGISGFDGGKLNSLADAKLFVETKKGEYEVVETVHSAILHMMTRFFRHYFSKPQY